MKFSQLGRRRHPFGKTLGSLFRQSVCIPRLIQASASPCEARRRAYPELFQRAGGSPRKGLIQRAEDWSYASLAFLRGVTLLPQVDRGLSWAPPSVHSSYSALVAALRVVTNIARNFNRLGENALSSRTDTWLVVQSVCAKRISINDSCPLIPLRSLNDPPNFAIEAPGGKWVKSWVMRAPAFLSNGTPTDWFLGAISRSLAQMQTPIILLVFGVTGVEFRTPISSELLCSEGPRSVLSRARKPFGSAVERRKCLAPGHVRQGLFAAEVRPAQSEMLKQDDAHFGWHVACNSTSCWHEETSEGPRPACGIPKIWPVVTILARR